MDYEINDYDVNIDSSIDDNNINVDDVNNSDVDINSLPENEELADISASGSFEFDYSYISEINSSIQEVNSSIAEVYTYLNISNQYSYIIVVLLLCFVCMYAFNGLRSFFQRIGI